MLVSNMIKMSKGWFGRSSFMLGMLVLTFLTSSVLNNTPPGQVLVATVLLILIFGPVSVLWDSYSHQED